MTPMNANAMYRIHLRELMSKDHTKLRVVSPRGQETWEHKYPHTASVSMDSPLVTDPARKLGTKFAFAEAAWVLRGQNTLKAHPQIEDKLAKFSDDGFMMRGAYGPKVVDQMPFVVANLLKDEDSRQAVISIWRERPGDSKDIPCTIALQFYIRGMCLHCHAMMRSNDIFWGTPYDWFTFTMVAEMVRSYLNLSGKHYGRGMMHITATSRHMYMRDMDAIEKYLAYDPQPHHYELLPNTWSPEELLRLLDIGSDQGLTPLLEGPMRMFQQAGE